MNRLRRRSIAKRRSTTAITDSFNRADSATTLGNTDTGQIWQIPTSGAVFGISSNAAYLVNSTSQAIAVVDSGKSDCTMQITLAGGTDSGFCFRVTDDSNNFVAEVGDGKIYRRQSGSFNLVATMSSSGVGTYKVVLSGSTITVYLNNTQVASFTDTFNQTATKHGIRSNANNAQRFDNFSVV